MTLPRIECAIVSRSALSSSSGPAYLEPYVQASAKHGAAFRSLLWASPKTQRVRFEAIRRIIDIRGRSLLDVGCGRADLLTYLREHNSSPLDYTGVEAVEALAAAAEAAVGPGGRIIRADFVREPHRLFVAADLVAFSGSLNTLNLVEFQASLRTAFEAANQGLAFNFLSSPLLAGKHYLVWHEPKDVLQFARCLSSRIRLLDDYLPGDCTMAILKPENGKAEER